MRLAEGVLARRAERRLAVAYTGSGGRRGEDEATALRETRLEAKRRIGARGPAYMTLKMLTIVMKLDVVLFGRIPSGPFFALLTKE